jgi:hypothetical protein
VAGQATAFGCLQISRCVLADVRRITGERFTPSQCFDRFTSLSVCTSYLRHYCTKERLGHEPTVEDMARVWVGGPDGWKKESTLPYWAKVQEHLYPGATAGRSQTTSSVDGERGVATPNQATQPE